MMDHFLPIQDPAYETPKVLFLYNEKFPYMFDGKGMKGFPARRMESWSPLSNKEEPNL